MDLPTINCNLFSEYGTTTITIHNFFGDSQIIFDYIFGHLFYTFFNLKKNMYSDYYVLLYNIHSLKKIVKSVNYLQSSRNLNNNQNYSEIINSKVCI